MDNSKKITVIGFLLSCALASLGYACLLAFDKAPKEQQRPPLIVSILGFSGAFAVSRTLKEPTRAKKKAKAKRGKSKRIRTRV